MASGEETEPLAWVLLSRRVHYGEGVGRWQAGTDKYRGSGTDSFLERCSGNAAAGLGICIVLLFLVFYIQRCLLKRQPDLDLY